MRPSPSPISTTLSPPPFLQRVPEVIAQENNSFHNWDAGLQFLSDKEISGKLFELRDFTFTSALPVGKDRTKICELHEKSLSLCAHVAGIWFD